MANRINVNLDTNKNIYDIFECKQNDDLLLEANIFENGIQKDISNATITINCTRADGTYVIQNTDITKEGNKIIANLKRDFTRVDGLDKLEIVLLENEKQNTTFDFNILVKPSVLKTAVEESKDTVIILEELGNKIVEGGQVKAETEELIATGNAATKGDIAKVNSQLEQITQYNYNLINKVDNIDDYWAYYCLGQDSIDSDCFYFSSNNNNHVFGFATPTIDVLEKGIKYRFSTTVEKVGEVTSDRLKVRIMSSSNSLIQELALLPFGEINLEFTPSTTFNNVKIMIITETKTSSNKELLRVSKNTILSLASISVNNIYSKNKLKEIDNNAYNGKRKTLFSSRVENDIENGAYASFFSGVYFNGKEYHCCRVGADHEDNSLVENGFGKIMFFIKDEEGVWTKKVLNLPTTQAYRDPSLVLSPDGKYMILKVVINNGQNLGTGIKYKIGICILDKDLNGINSSGEIATSNNGLREIYGTNEGDLNIQSYGNFVFTPNGNMLLSGYVLQGEPLALYTLKSTATSYLTITRVEVQDTIKSVASGSIFPNEACLFYWKNRLWIIYRMGGSGNPSVSEAWYTDNLNDTSNDWVKVQSLKIALFSPTVLGSYQGGDKVFLAGTYMNTSEQTRKPVIVALSLKNDGIESSIPYFIDNDVKWGAYPSFIRNNNGFASCYYEDSDFGTKAYYKEYSLPEESFKSSTANNSILYTPIQTQPLSGVVIKQIKLENDWYQLMGTVPMSATTTSKTRAFDLPFVFDNVGCITATCCNIGTGTGAEEFSASVGYTTNTSKLTINVTRVNSNSDSKDITVNFNAILRRKF